MIDNFSKINNFVYEKNLLFVFIGIFIFSFILALISMRNFIFPREIKSFLKEKKSGRIVFLDGKTKHYSSE